MRQSRMPRISLMNVSRNERRVQQALCGGSHRSSRRIRVGLENEGGRLSDAGLLRRRAAANLAGFVFRVRHRGRLRLTLSLC
jgi:hypothetical protein